VQKDKDILKVVGINSKGFGNIPKLLMQDRRITPEAKCIYAYFASYAGAGSSAFPSVSKIIYDLCMCKTRYYKHFKLLDEHGYITVERVKESGKFSHNIYILNTKIEPRPRNEDTEPCPKFGDTVNGDTVNEDTNTNNSNTNSINKRKYKKKEKETGKTAKKDKYEKFYL